MILVVDDDPSVVASLGLLLEQHGHACASADDPETALARLGTIDCKLVIQDMNFSRGTSGEEGLELVRRIKQRHPELPVVLLTAWGSIELAVEGMKAGASDFLTKPWDNRQLLSTIETVLEVEAAQRVAAPVAPKRADLDAQYDFAPLLGHDPNLLRILNLAGRVSATDASVLITGESGTGKELLADAIHRNSKRATGPYVKVNLGGISSTLFESEMFGHVRGAFTDAKQGREGRFAAADGGTIFLDEIGEVEPSTQVKLLRVLQDRSYEILGSNETRRVDVRVVSATNRDLASAVADGSFREDLLYRLNLISIELPPLRARSGDIRLLADHLLRTASSLYGRPADGFTAAALDWLERQPWPGNVRQLKQVVERGLLVGASPLLDVSDLEAPPGSAPSDVPTTLSGITLEEMERRMVEQALQRVGGNVSRAAKELGLSRAALYRRCQKYDLEIARD